MPLYSVRARGDHRPDSDTDIIIEIDPAAPVGVYEYVSIKNFIASLFDGRVDVVNRDGLKPYIRPMAIADAIMPFEALGRWLNDIANHIDTAQVFASGMTYDNFRNDLRTTYAVI